MSEYEVEPTDPIEPVYRHPAPVVDEYSPFWPLMVLMAGLILWSGYQAYTGYAQNAVLTAEFKNAAPEINAAQDARSRLISLGRDLIATSQKDAGAAQIVREEGISLRSNSTNSGH